MGLQDSYTGKCTKDLFLNFFKEVAIPTQKALDDYLATKFIPKEDVIKVTFDKLHEQFNNIMALTNDQVTNGDYQIRYNIVEEKLKDTVGFLENLAAA